MKIGSNDVSKLYLGGSEIGKVYLGTTQVYGGSQPQPDPYSKQYLTFVAKESGTFTFTPKNSNVISYSTDNGDTWTQGNSISVNSGDKVMWKGTMTPASSSNYGIGTFSSTGNFDVEGNAMSLLFGDNFKGQTDLTGKNFAFFQFFNDNKKVVSAENMILPATTLVNHCYFQMFFGCTSLTTSPALPATTLTSNCYNSMFSNCTSLTTPPELPATTLANYCYNYMFINCPITTAPELPATTLADSCYTRMFYHCNSLNYIKCLATDISASNCTTNWVEGVSASGTLVKAASMNDWTTGTSGIPNGWTVQNDSEIIDDGGDIE